MKYDVIVCGGGVVGLWTANHLAEQKKSVLLLEQVRLYFQTNFLFILLPILEKKDNN